MKQKIEIKGSFAFDVNKKRFVFLSEWGREMFEKGFHKSDYSHYILVSYESISFDVPEDFDVIKPQLDALDSQEKELTFQYNQALQHIRVQRNNLLALEN